jgi:hypothetical protein
MVPLGLVTLDRIDRELRDHIERQVADYVASGMSEPDAPRRVRVEFGGLEQANEHPANMSFFAFNKLASA